MFKAKAVVAFMALIAGAALIAPSASAQVGYGGKGSIGGGGGGGSIGCYQSIQAPAGGFTVSISNQNGSTATRLVQLTIKPGNASRMSVSNDASFSNASIEPANGAKDWTLSEGEGSKTVYVRFYDECGTATTPVSATVNFSAALPTTTTTTTDNGQVLGERISKVDDLIATLRYGRRASAVLELQNELVRLGYMPRGWKSTTYYGPVTLGAVNRYVDKMDADLDEMVGRLTYGQTHPDVRRLSRQLQAKGFLAKNVRISSYYGVAVRAAVAKYNASR